MLAQDSSAGSSIEAIGLIIVLAIVAFQIYLIWAIIATRQDVKAIRQLLSIGGAVGAASAPTRPRHYDEHEVVFVRGGKIGVCVADGCDFETDDSSMAKLHERSRGLEGWDDSEEAGEYKTCPDCAEEVLAEARKCRFCGHVFEDVAPPLQA